MNPRVEDNNSAQTFEQVTKDNILKRVPKAARWEACRLLTATIDEILDKNSAESWSALFNFARVCFEKPTKKKFGKGVSLSTMVKRQLSAYPEESEVCSKGRAGKAKKGGEEKEPNLKKIVAGKIS